MAADITAIILTKNEEVNIEECIKSIIATVKRIVVIDSFSTDKTVEIAKRMEQKFISIRLKTMPNSICMVWKLLKLKLCGH